MNSPHILMCGSSCLACSKQELPKTLPYTPLRLDYLLTGFNFPMHFSILGDNRKEPVFFCCTPECGWTIEYRHFKILPMTSALSRFWYMAFIASVSFMFFSASI